MEQLFTANPSHPAIIMAQSGETITHGQLEARANKIAHLLRAMGLKRSDHFAVFMENHPRYIECGFGAERAGLYYTNINSYLTPGELAYIVNNSLSQVLVTSQSHLAIAREALRECPRVKLCLVVDGPSEGDAVRNLDEATAAFPDTPIPDESKGWAMLYSSGTTGQPKGILRPLSDTPARQLTPLGAVLAKFWEVGKGEICLVPAPLYHSAPWAEAGLALGLDGTAVVMERFDEEAVLRAIETYRVTHAQFVPTMFSRMLKLPPEVRARYDLSSLRYVLHGAAPCPIPVKQAMIDWLGPIVHEYYAATEGFGLAICDSEQWLAHKGTVGKAVFGEVHILDAEMREVPPGSRGQALVQDRPSLRILQRPGEDGGGELAGPHDEHGERHRLCRRGGLHLSDRPRVVHDHLRRGQHLSAGMREPARHASQGARCGGVRRAQRRDGRGGQGRGSARGRSEAGA